jgi:hypothetical protein
MYYFKFADDFWYAYKIINGKVSDQWFAEWCNGKQTDGKNYEASGTEENPQEFWPCKSKEEFFTKIAGEELYFTQAPSGNQFIHRAWVKNDLQYSWWSAYDYGDSFIKPDANRFACNSLQDFIDFVISQTQNEENLMEKKKSVYLKVMKMKDSSWPLSTTIGEVQSLEQGQKLLEMMKEWPRPFLMVDMIGMVVTVTEDHQLVIG